jgi:hypothetical protein
MKFDCTGAAWAANRDPWEAATTKAPVTATMRVAVTSRPHTFICSGPLLDNVAIGEEYTTVVA